MPHLLDPQCVSRQGRFRSAETRRLTVITKDNLSAILLGLKLQEMYGIGERMEQRLHHRAGILTVVQLWSATPFQLRRVWGGINGVMFHQMLHGVDIQPPSSRFSKSIGHQHVLEPDVRTISHSTCSPKPPSAFGIFAIRGRFRHSRGPGIG